MGHSIVIGCNSYQDTNILCQGNLNTIGAIYRLPLGKNFIYLGLFTWEIVIATVTFWFIGCGTFTK